MNRWAHFAVLSVLLAGPDVPKTYDLRPISPLLPMVPGPAMATAADPQPNPPSVFVSVTQTSNGTKQAALKPSSRLQIIRYVSGEFAHADKAIPGARKGYRVVVGKPIDENAL